MVIWPWSRVGRCTVSDLLGVRTDNARAPDALFAQFGDGVCYDNLVDGSA